MTKTIKIACNGSRMEKLDSLEIIQGDLKGLSDENLRKLKKRIETKGFDAPIFVWQNIILDGTQRKRALESLIAEGWKLAGGKVPVCDIQALNMDEAKDRLLGYVSQYGKISLDGLKEYLDTIKMPDLDTIDLPEVDWEAFREKYLHPQQEGLTPDDEIPDPPKKAKTKTGDLYILGEHRLLCGDSTKAEDVERLMDGQKADMVFTSPPYNLGISSKLSGNTKIAKQANVYNEINDNQTEENWLILISSFTKLWVSISKYCFINLQSLAGNRTVLWSYLNEFKEYFCDVAIWDKQHAPPQQAERVMNSQFEFVFIFSNNNPNRAIRIAPKFRGTISNIYSGNPQRENVCPEVHGATFPVHFPEYFIGIFSGYNNNICDPFLGSGTTLIACEKLNRRCFGMEIDPIYCDVIVKRWEDFIGNKAERIRTKKC